MGEGRLNSAYYMQVLVCTNLVLNPPIHYVPTLYIYIFFFTVKVAPEPRVHNIITIKHIEY